jgi:hypothetical protein
MDQGESLSESMLPEKAQQIAQNLYAKINELTKVDTADDIDDVTPGAVQDLIVREVDALGLTEAQNNQMFDVYMPLHRLEHTFKLNGNILCYRVSHNDTKCPEANKIAIAWGYRSDAIVQVIRQIETGDWGIQWTGFVSNIESIYWNANDVLYTIHPETANEPKCALEWASKGKSYSLAVTHVPAKKASKKLWKLSNNVWKEFYTKHNIDIGANDQSNACVEVEKVSDDTIKVRSVVSSYLMMHRFLRQEYERKCDALREKDDNVE